MYKRQNLLSVRRAFEYFGAEVEVTGSRSRILSAKAVSYTHLDVYKRQVYDRQSMYLHLPQPGQSTAEHILSTYRADQKFTKEEAKLLDLCLVLHADHGGGNNSTFACRVLSSSGTDTYSAISAAIGSLKAVSYTHLGDTAMQIYGYCRISTPQQNIERQVRNILVTYPTAHIIREVYTGTTYQGRRELDKLLPVSYTHLERLLCGSYSVTTVLSLLAATTL